MSPLFSRFCPRPCPPVLVTLVFAFFLALLPGGAAWPQDFYPGHDIEVLRGELRIDMEPIYGGFIDPEYPLREETLHRRALEEAAMFYSAMIYGWSFYYDIGERARGIEEHFELLPLGSIPWGDRGLRATDSEVRDQQFCLWTDYRLDESQKRRVALWRAGGTRRVQGLGRGPLGMPLAGEPPETEAPAGAGTGAPGADPAVAGRSWLDYRREALEDAARTAIRAMLRGSERNRPKEARGRIALAAFPVTGIVSGRWQVSAKFRLELTERTPFAAY
jgi:hypothetical protein